MKWLQDVHKSNYLYNYLLECKNSKILHICCCFCCHYLWFNYHVTRRSIQVNDRFDLKTIGMFCYYRSSRKVFWLHSIFTVLLIPLLNALILCLFAMLRCWSIWAHDTHSWILRYLGQDLSIWFTCYSYESGCCSRQHVQTMVTNLFSSGSVLQPKEPSVRENKTFIQVAPLRDTPPPPWSLPGHADPLS